MNNLANLLDHNGAFYANSKYQIYPVDFNSVSDMGNILDPTDLKWIIALHLGGYKNYKIWATLSISHNTVKNNLFTGSHDAAQRVAMIYTFFAICKSMR